MSAPPGGGAQPNIKGAMKEEEIIDEDTLTDKQKLRRKMETNREAVKDEIKAMTPFEIFALFDDDDSGLIDFDEFKRMLPFLDIYISELKAFRYFRICDSDGGGEIDFDEFKVALFICDSTGGNPVGFTPSSSLTPTDAFETFNEAQNGYMDEDEFFYAMEYMNLNPTDHLHEKLFHEFDTNHTGTIDYFEFKEVFLMLCDVRKELEDRNFDVPTFTRRKTLVLILRGYLDDEERKERQAIAEAKRYKKWILSIREKKKVLQKAGFRAYQELRKALDEAGHVYVFGGGAHKQFDGRPFQDMGTDRFKFQFFDRIIEMWKDRVKPEQLVDKLKNIRKAEEEEEARDLTRGADGMGALGQIDAGKKVIIDPYKEALLSPFAGLNVAVNTCSLWGRRIHHVAVSENVIFALADTGEVYTWGGNNYWWHEIQPDSLYQTKWRGDTTARSQLLLGTVDKQLPPDASLDNVKADEDMTPEEKMAEHIKVVTKYYDLWEPPPNPATRMVYLMKELVPKLQYDDLLFSMKARGKDMGEKTKLELIEELYEDIVIEKKLLGERAHKAIRELETQVSDLLRRKKTKLANKFLKRIDDMWLPLREVQAEQRAAEIARKLAKQNHDAMKIETDYQYYRTRLMEKRESVENTYTPRGNSLHIDLSGMTPRANGMKTPRGFQSSIQIAAGTAHACLVHQSGQLYAWGMGAAGRLGLDVTEDGDPQKDVIQPRLIQALAGRPVVRVACGYSHTGCIVSGGDLFMWGSAANGKCGLGEIVMRQDCYCSIPTRVMIGKEDKKIRKVSCGSAHTAVVTESGQVFIFGCGDGGRLGLGIGNYETVCEPVLVPELENIQNVSCGNTTTFALTAVKYEWVGKDGGRHRKIQGGKVYMSGSQNVLGRQCDTFQPLKIPGNKPIKMISAGFQHQVFTSAEGEMMAFGFNRKICCGVAPQAHFIPEPTIVNCLYANPTNIALNARAYQSSTFDMREAKYAANGDTSGNGVDKISLTQQDAQAWLEIDLGKMAIIEEVKVWNRTDVPKDRHVSKDTYTNKLFPCWVMVGRDPFDPQLNQVGFKNNLRNAVAKAKFTENQRVSSWHCPTNTQGRYVRVQLEQYQQLGLAEVEVFGNFGLSKGVGRVSYAVAGRDVTVAVVRPSPDPVDIEVAFKRAAFADAGNADVLRQFETYALEYDKFGRGEVLMKTCFICKGDIKCESCQLYDTYGEEIDRIPPGIGGRRRRLNSIDEFLININKPELEIYIQPKHNRPTKAQKRNHRIRDFFSGLGLMRSRKPAAITPDQAVEMDPETNFEKVVFEEEAKAHAEGRDPLIDSKALVKEEDKEKKTSKKFARRAKAMGEPDEEKKDSADHITAMIGESVLPGVVKSNKMSDEEIQATIPRVGEKLLTGQLVKPSIPRSISEPAAQSDEYLADERERNKNKKLLEEQEVERQRLLRAQGDIS